MKKVLIGFLLVLLASTAFAMEVGVLGVVSNGNISATAKYYSFGGGGDEPFTENRYASTYTAQGTGGLSFVSTFGGGMETREQFELQSGVGWWETKAGTGVLVNVTNSDTGVITGTLGQNAVGFGGFIKNGIANTQLTTSNGLTGVCESQGIGTFRAGGVQTIMVGTSEPGAQPSIVNSFEAHWQFGPGQYQAQVQINFPAGK